MRTLARLAMLALSLGTMPAAAAESAFTLPCQSEWSQRGDSRGQVLLCRMGNGAVYYRVRDTKTGRTTAPRLDNGE